MTDYNLLGIQNFAFSNLEKLLKSTKIEERVKEGLLHNDIDKITQLTYEKILDKLSDMLSEELIKQLKENGQKPTKVEPKFKVGDWITNGYYTWKITDIKPLDYILQSQNGNDIYDTISYVDEHFHLWAIQDAKDGDVLYSPCCELLWIYKDEKTCHVGYNLNYNSNSIVINKLICIPNNVQPATKEQRDILFQKMKKEGYEWNAEKKECNLTQNNVNTFT